MKRKSEKAESIPDGKRQNFLLPKNKKPTDCGFERNRTWFKEWWAKKEAESPPKPKEPKPLSLK